MDRVYFGNAATENIDGWFIGQFIPQELGPRHQTDVELKWGVHPAGETRAQSWGRYNKATTISILIQGIFQINFRVDGEVKEILLQKQGDYVTMPPGVEHSWIAITDSVVMSVRFPSLPGDQVNFS
jgi:hypothetical protein